MSLPFYLWALYAIRGVSMSQKALQPEKGAECAETFIVRYFI
jgi:hypothetical protein